MTSIWTVRSAGLALAGAILLWGCGGSGNEKKNDDAKDSAAPGVTTVPGTDDTLDAAWTMFWNDFRAAVRQRDSAAIAGMMGAKFEYGTTPKASSEEVFRELAYGDSINWRVLDQTLDRGTQTYAHPSSSRPARVAINPQPCDTPPCRYQSWAIFQQESDGGWRWTALLFPGD